MAAADFVITTYSGIKFPLDAPRTEHININDIAHHLSLVNRFGGATRVPYNVAQHSVRVCQHVAVMGGDREDQLLGLLHDAHEAYYGDIPTPLKRLLVYIAGATDYGNLTDACDDVIFARWNVRGDYALVKLADRKAYEEEENTVREWSEKHAFRVWDWREAKSMFLIYFHRLTYGRYQ